MNLRLSIHFHTQFGQNLYVLGSIPELGENNPAKAVPLNFSKDFVWNKEIRIISSRERVIYYKYFVKNSDNSVFYEVGEARKIALNNNSRNLFFMDQWQGNTPVAPFLSAPFTRVFSPHKGNPATQTHLFSKELIIRVTVPDVKKNTRLFICGNTPSLGQWNPEKGVPMLPVQGSKWEAHFSAGKMGKAIEYKFVKKHEGEQDFIWEGGENRKLEIPTINTNETYSVEHSIAAFETVTPRFAGTAVPLFSLRSKNDCGIGDFSDLKLLADWAVLTGQSVIQILPINDTTATETWHDSYPYNAISTMALHPIYLNIEAVGEIKEELNAPATIDYETVWAFKKKYTRKAFETFGEETFAEPDFYTFYKENKSWLLPYCSFCILRDRFKTSDFTKWGEYSVYSPKIPDKLNDRKSDTYREISYYLFVQYHLHKQFSESVKYLHDKGIALKGDIPIGINPHSVDAWTHPHLFNMDCQAGAPPDQFSSEGQNWGFPTYNWEEMAKDNYKWWKTRLVKMAEYFDLYRIDHILGFFRIWEIPLPEKSSLMGHFSPALPLEREEILKKGFNHITDDLFIEDLKSKGKFHPKISAQKTPFFNSLPEREKEIFNDIHFDYFFKRHNDLWREQALLKLPDLISATNMLPCAEDLGMIPDCLPVTLAELRILSLKIQGTPSEYPYLSVCSTGTHDTLTLRERVGEDIDTTSVIKECLESPSMFTILPIGDWLSTDRGIRREDPSAERINDPANKENKWNYRIHIPLEELIENESFNNKILELINKSR